MQSINFESVRSCPHCGLFSELPNEISHVDINCPRCDYRFARKRPLSKEHTLAFAISGFLFCLILISAHFLDVSLYGRHQTTTLWGGPEVLDQQQLLPLAIIVALATLLLPILKLALIIAVILLLRLENPPSIVIPILRWIKYISPWAMLEVYLLGLIVAYTRLQAMAYINLDVASYALVGAILCMAMVDSRIDMEGLWNSCRKKFLNIQLDEADADTILGCETCHQVSKTNLGDDCPRCQAVLNLRKVRSIQQTWALLIAGILCYIPANLLPVMQISRLGKPRDYTITGGMLEIAHHGLVPLAALVFVASIAIPLLKILSLSYLLLTTHNQSRKYLKHRTKLYRVVSFIGRWSMVDIFMVSILVALMHFGHLTQIKAEIGGLFFASVVILTMIAAERFDARLMWDAADQNDQQIKQAIHG